MTEEIKISGTIGPIETRLGDEYRRILADCGGIILMRDYILSSYDYKQDDRVVVSVSPCEEDERFYPHKPRKNG